MQWFNNSTTAISPLSMTIESVLATRGRTYFASSDSGTSYKIHRYTYDTQATEVIAEAKYPPSGASWASGDRVIFAGLSGDFVLWDSGSFTTLSTKGWGGVSDRNVAWFEQTSGTSVDVFLYDGDVTRLLGSYVTTFANLLGMSPTIAVSDSVVAWNVLDGNVYVATLVPEPSTCSSLVAGLAIGSWHVLRRRKA
jgi:hypothetical protein